MKKILILSFITLLGFFISGCGNTNNKSIKEIREMIASNNPPNLVIDVRSHLEYNEYHIPRAIWIEYTDIEHEISHYTSSKNNYLIVYCRSGNRSHIAYNTLVKMGYRNVFDFGAISNWE